MCCGGIDGAQDHMSDEASRAQSNCYLSALFSLPLGTNQSNLLLSWCWTNLLHLCHSLFFTSDDTFPLSLLPFPYSLHLSTPSSTQEEVTVLCSELNSIRERTVDSRREVCEREKQKTLEKCREKFRLGLRRRGGLGNGSYRKQCLHLILEVA